MARSYCERSSWPAAQGSVRHPRIVDAKLEQLWLKVEALEIAPGVSGAEILAEGANAASIRDFEASIGLALPPEIHDSFLRHNGQRGNTGYYAFSGANFLSLRESIEERARRIAAAESIFGPMSGVERRRPENIEGPVQREYWMEGWIPILKRNKEPICVDLRPPPGGRVGQLIEVDWEGGTVRVVANSIATFLNDCGADV